MATISSVIKLHDGMSPALRSMNKALGIVLTSFESMQRMSGKAIDTASIKAALNELAKANVYLDRVEQNINQNTTAQRRFNSEVKGGTGAMGNLANQVKMLVGAYVGIQSIGGIIKTADAFTMTNARLNMINDGLQTTAQLEDKIYQAAMRSRGGFMETADAVAKLGQRAGDLFKSNDETIAFTETLNKMFVIAGASQGEMASATLQLTQALGAGVLRGEEFNAVFEAAPNVMRAIADSMDVPIGSLKEMASEGKISAEAVKNAILGATADVNKQFNAIPYTWGQVWTTVQNYTLKATRPILQAISDLTRNERFIRFANGLGNAISFAANLFRNLWTVAAPILGGIFDMVAWVADCFTSGWSIIAPIVAGVAAAFLVLKTPLMMVAIWTKLCTVATKLWTAAQAVFNAVMALNPVGLVIIAVIALVALFYAAIAAVNKWCGTSLSATGLIAGAITWLWARLQNIFIGIGNAFIGVYNIAVGVAQWCVSAWNWAGENMGTIFENIGIWWDNLWIDAQIGFNNFISSVLSKLASLAQTIAPLAEMLDIDLSGIAGAANKYSAKSAKLASSKKSYKKTTAFNPDVKWDTAQYMDFKNMGAAFDKGYNWGSNVGDKAGAFFSGGDYNNLTKGLTGGLDANGMNDIGKALSGALGNGISPESSGAGALDKNPTLDKIAKGVGATAKNTDPSNQLDRSEGDLSFMRDLATRNAINRHYHTNMQVSQTNNNSINSEMDIDDVVNRFRSKLMTSLSARAEGVHF